jgi:hypothetical protein
MVEVHDLEAVNGHGIGRTANTGIQRGNRAYKKVVKEVVIY